MDRLDVYPLQRMTADTEPAHWSAYTPPTNGDRERWTVTTPIRLWLPGVALLDVVGDGWECDRRGWIDAQPGYWWDGASGPAIDDPQAVMASIVHDIVCTPVYCLGQRTHPLPSYMARHALYRRILRANGAALGRAWYSWAALVAANWWVDAGSDGE